VKGDRPWMTVLKNKSGEIKALKVGRSPAAHKAELGEQTESQTLDAFPSESKDDEKADATLQGVTEPEKMLPDGTQAGEMSPAESDAEVRKSGKLDQKDAGAAASSAEEKSLSSGSTGAAMPKPGMDSQNEPLFAQGDIVTVRARQRKEYDGCKAKVLGVLTGDVRVEILDGSTVGTDARSRKFKFAQVSLVTTDGAADQSKKTNTTRTTRRRRGRSWSAFSISWRALVMGPRVLHEGLGGVSFRHTHFEEQVVGV